MKIDGQLYTLCARCEEIFIRKDGWSDGRPLHLDTVEISPQVFCFEWAAGEEFRAGEELDLQLYLPEGLFRTRVTVLAVEACELLDEGYELKPCFTFCTRFHGELDGSLFRSIAGTPRRCRSFSKGADENAGELVSE